MTKICSKCKVDKELDEFNKNKYGKYGLHHYCKSCLSNFKKNSYDYVKSKNRTLLSKYKLNMQQVENLYIMQEKRCKICDIEYPTVSKHKGLYIDHCHNTGKVRGLLCAKCNSLLGSCKDSVVILKSAIDYIINS
jgi:hypothetical protein